MQKLSEEIVKNALKEYDDDKKNELIRFLCMYRIGEYIYPSVLKRNMKVTQEKVDYVLDMLVQSGIAEKCFQFYCPNCGMAAGKFLKEDENLSDEIYCDRCDEEISKSNKQYAYIIKGRE